MHFERDHKNFSEVLKKYYILILMSQNKEFKVLRNEVLISEPFSG